jgi:xanthine dehydrogenase YagR molybdenum-binding subunit
MTNPFSRKGCLPMSPPCVRSAIPPEGIEAEGTVVAMTDDPNRQAYSIHTYGAHFAELGVDVDTAEIRLQRMLGVFAVGPHPEHQDSPLAARRWHDLGSERGLARRSRRRPALRCVRQPRPRPVPGAGARRHSADRRCHARRVRRPKANVLGVKGVGELGICGSGAAVANAVFNATGVRVRDFPITLDKVLPGLPQPDV